VEISFLELQFDLLEFIILSLFTFGWVVQLSYYLFIYARVPSRKTRVNIPEKSPVPVSVVICARDEADNLEKNLPSILNQDYPDYEVIVVDDCSMDDTDTVLQRFELKYPRLRRTTIKQDDKFSHGKKLALTIGIKAAKNEWVLLTDADCLAENRNWIKTMASNFDEKAGVVLGYGGYISREGFLNRLIRFDTFFIALQYIGFALAGMPYMGVGRNLAYRKSLFMQNKGFARHAHLLSGDDDLLVKEIACKSNTRVEISVDAHTRSFPKTSFSSWARQKKRHMSTAGLYKAKHKLLLSLEPMSRLLSYITFVLLMVISDIWVYVLAAFLFLFIIKMLVMGLAMAKLNEKRLIFLAVLFDILLPVFNLGFYVSGSLTKTNRKKWK
jgi:poly-beta-1,6-N-acetyl-D-glucosamine synthase